MSQRFDLASTPLHRGVNLIEASAGTGKTFTIAGLFVRLIVEHEVPVEQILVVTFTEAATGELRDRIRARLNAARRAFEVVTAEAGDELLATLVAQHRDQAREMAARLDLACREFDQAAIYTIHGFCQRVLKDRAFESGQLFDLELVTDAAPLLREVCDDFWRQRFYQASALRVCAALASGLSPVSLCALLTSVLRHPDIELLPHLSEGDGERFGRGLESAFRSAADLWQRDAETIRSFFGDGISWGNKPFNRTAEIGVHLANLAALFAGEFSPEAMTSVAVFTPHQLAEGVNKRRRDACAPAHPFFDACAALANALSQYALATRLELIGFARAELPLRKNRAKAQTFDDLLTRLRDALASTDGGEALASSLRQKFQAALIDEFQDTDPVQWEIFRRVFACDDRWLFLIGDPKQAIYSFRGADIYAYLGAAEATPGTRRFTLGTNWRSESALVAAVNTMFSHRDNPFVVPQIEFSPVAACGRADREPLTENGIRSAPLCVWLYPRSEDGKGISNTAAEPMLAESTASEIVRLLNGGAMLGNRPLRPEDIAVLVDRNDQARSMQEALAKRGVPAVLHATASLFESHEAEELERLLAAITEPGNERLVKAALATDLLGLTANRLDALAHDDATWQQHAARFHEYLARWNGAGFIQMFGHLLQREQIRSRLLRLTDGERRLTNVLHLAEVLQQAAVEQRLGVNGVVKWLGEQRGENGERSEEFQLRLERDDNAVRLVTIHRSKGLEYPVVFVPFCWRNAELGKGRGKSGVPEIVFHQPDGARSIQRDLGSPDLDQHTLLAQEERLAENVRLFYVALTRARNRCYFAWGGFNNAASSAPAWLLHQPRDAATALSSEFAGQFKALTEPAIASALAALAQQAGEGSDGLPPPMEMSPLPELSDSSYQPPTPSPADALQARRFTAHIPRDGRITSFSALTAGGHEELPDRDSAISTPAESSIEPAAATPPTGIFAFPRGARPGACLHEVFEDLDFTETRTEIIAALANEKLRTAGIDATKHAAPVVEMVRRTLAVPLDPAHPEFTLSRVPLAARLNELEFYFPLKRITPGTLREVFTRHGAGQAAGGFPAHLERLRFDPVAGFMKGFMDLVFEHDGRFYLVDWKSNWLGARVEDYGPAALGEEMRARHYVLQYHLYVLALDRYLATRLRGYDYARDFGGVIYVFLRGIDPARPELGLFRDRPTPELVRDLRDALLDWKEVAQ